MSKKYLNSKHKNLYLKIIGFLIKSGNKGKATLIINKVFLRLSKELNLPFNKILLKLFLKLNCFVEVKKVRIRRGIHLVPFPISSKRSSYLIVKWLMQAVKEDKRNISTYEKLFTEIKQTLEKSTSKSVEIKNLNISQALANRSNIHFRW